MTEIMAYHGSGCIITSFDYAFTGQGIDQNGSGFYFTDSLHVALDYTTRQISNLTKPGGEDAPTVHVAKLRFNKLIGVNDSFPITLDDVRFILKRAPHLDAALSNWGDIEYEGYKTVFERACEAYTHEADDGPVIKQLFSLANDFFEGDTEGFNRAIIDRFGVDGVVEVFEDGMNYVVFTPEQITILEHIPAHEVERMLDQQQREKRLTMSPA